MEAMQTATENTDSKKTILCVDDDDIALDVWSQMCVFRSIPAGDSG
jgi:hypothetical protein